MLLINSRGFCFYIMGIIMLLLKFKRNLVVFLLTLLYSTLVFSGGIALDATRLIYPLNSKQMSTGIRNTDEKKTFLIQAWVEDSDGKKTEDFIVTPPLFTSAPTSENILRVVLLNKSVLEDREKLYYFNVKAIPSIEKNSDGQNSLIIAAVTRIKLFVRPNGLKFSPTKAVDQLKFKYENNQILIKNPTGYYITISSVNDGDKDIGSGMVEPFGEIKISAPGNLNTSNISYSIINDFGGLTGPKKAIFE